MWKPHSGDFELQPSITDHAVTPVAEEKTEHSGEVPEVVFSHVGLTYAGAGEESLTDIDFTVKRERRSVSSVVLVPENRR